MERVQDNWVEIQTGLYLEEQTRTIGGVQRTFRYLHSGDGYCFYDVEDALIDDGEGNMVRIYYQYSALAIQMSSWTYEQLNEKFISIPVEDNFIIASLTPPAVEM